MKLEIPGHVFWTVIHKDGRLTEKGEEGEANARLIAAAPDLYEALKEAIGIIKIFHGPVAWDIYEKQSPEMRRFHSILAKVQS